MHQPGDSLDLQRQAAKKQIDSEAKRVNENIQNDPTLTDKIKADQQQKVAEEAKKAQDNIDSSNNAQMIKNAKNSSLKAIEYAYQSGESIDKQRVRANEEIAVIEKATKTAINSEKTLNDDEKKSQIDAVDREVTAAKSTLAEATNAQQILDEKSEATSSISNLYQPSKISVADQKQAAANATSLAATKTIDAINSDVTWKKEDKQKLIDKVKQAKDSIITNLNDLDNAQAIKTTEEDGIKQISGIHQINPTSLVDQKTAALKDIESSNNADINLVNNNNNLLQKKKNELLGNLKAKFEAAQQNIKNAQDAQGVFDTKNNSIKAMTDAIKVDEISLDVQKSTAESNLIATAAAVDKQITNDNSLINADKEVQKANLERAKNAAIKNVKNSNNADQVYQAKTDGNRELTNIYHTSSTSLEKQKQDAIESVKTAKNATNAEIEADDSLTSEEKDQQKAAVKEKTTAINSSINSAIDAQTVLDNKKTGINELATLHHKANQTVAEQKVSAIKLIDTYAQKTGELIDADKTLNDWEKLQQHQTLEANLSNVITDINRANNADEVIKKFNSGTDVITASHKINLSSVDNQKASAISSVKTITDTVNRLIEQDATLTDDEKSQQKKKAADNSDAVIGQINGVDNAQAILNAKNIGNIQIMNLHVAGDYSVAEQKENAIKAVQTSADNTKLVIDADHTLNDEQKKAQKDSVDNQFNQVKGAIETAENAQKILDEKNAGISQIVQLHQGSTLTLNEQKDVAITAIKDSAQKTDGLIDSDKTLNVAEKEQQKQKVAQSLSAAIIKIKEANQAQSILDNMKAGITTISADHQKSIISIANQKARAINAIKTSNETTKGIITSDVTLTDQQKATQITKINQLSDTGISQINASDDAQPILDIKNQTILTIAENHVSGDNLDKQKRAAQKVAENTATTTLNSITIDPTLNNQEKLDQKQKVENQLVAVQSLITAAKDAQALVDIQATDVAAISELHQSGDDLAKQKAAAKVIADNTANTTITAINADVTLADAAKATQVAATKTKLAETASAIETATDAQELLDIQASDLPVIIVTHQSGDDLAKQKAAAQVIANDTANTTIAAINADVTLLNQEKANQVGAAKTKLAETASAIEIATDAQELLDIQASDLPVIIATHQAGLDLDKQKDHVQKIADNVANALLQAIADDDTLTDEEKATQTAAVNAKLAEDTKSITAAAAAQELNDIQGTAMAEFLELYEPGEELAEQKTTAEQLVKNIALQTLKEIAADKTLVNLEKATQQAAVKAKATDLINAISNAKSAQALLKIQTTGLPQIIAIHRVGIALAAQKEMVKREVRQILTDKDELAQVEKLVNDAKDAQAVFEIKDMLEKLSAAKTEPQGVTPAKTLPQTGQTNSSTLAIIGQLILLLVGILGFKDFKKSFEK